VKPEFPWSARRIMHRTLEATAALAIALAALIGPRAALGAETPDSPVAKGLSIAREMDRRDAGFGNTTAQLKMILRNRGGQASTRELTFRTLETVGEEDGDKTLIVFRRPGDIEGTALLSYTRITASDDQWLYLPALKRVKRISSNNKSGPFVGSEFAYEDMLSQEVAKYTYRWLRDGPCGALQCFVVERVPVYENSGYTRQIIWIDQENYRAMRIDYYDRKGDRLKTLDYKGYRKYLDRYWRADELFMENHQTGKTTALVFSAYKFRTELRERDFTPGRLKRLR
jgi:outer membrane lipoprotein-sorting protein